ARAAPRRNRLGAVRRVYADLQASEPVGVGAPFPARRGVHAFLHAPLVPGELPQDQEHGGARLGEPPGSPGECPSFTERDCRLLAASRVLTICAAFRQAAFNRSTAGCLIFCHEATKPTKKKTWLVFFV